MPFSIHAAQPEHGPGIARVRVLAWQAAYRGLLPDALLDSLDIQSEAERWTSGMGNLPEERRIFVAVDDGPQAPGVIGFCACGPEREMDTQYDAEVYALYVLPGRQREGAGQALVRAAASWLRQMGHKKMVIYVLRDNHPARRFYEAVGGTLARERMWDIHGEKMAEVGYGYDLPAEPAQQE